MKSKWMKMGLIVILVGAGGYFFLKRKSHRSADGVQTRIVTAIKGDIEDTVDSTGEVAPLNRVELKPPVGGRIENILVDEGDKVRAGQILTWMSSSDRAAIIDAARARGAEEVKKWKDTYKPTPIVAPLSGVVILRNVVVGQTVDLSTVLFALSDKLIVLAHVDEVDIGRVKTKMPARITLDSYPDQPITGHVMSILFEGKNVSNVITYGVKIEPGEIPPFFRSQMTANLSLIVNQKKDVLLLPLSAVSENPNGEKQVLVPTQTKGKPEKKLVETGLEGGDKVEIVSGLNPGDQVLILSKRYAPQKGAAQSPLVMGGSQRSGQQQSGNTGNRRN